MAAPKKAATERTPAPRRRKVKGAAPMTYQSVRQPNLRAQQAAAARGVDGAVDVSAIIADNEQEK